ncbi:MAG: HAD family hydrolase [Anaerolineales bacterium]
MSPQMFDWIGFDADDTLWQNEIHYRQARAEFEEIMAGYGQGEGVDEVVNRVELENLSYYGYGAIGFVVSLIEAGIEITNGDISAADIQRLLDLSKEMISAEAELLPGAEQLVTELSQQYPLLLVTKGDLRHQTQKVERSGLRGYFKAVEVVSEKNPDVYRKLLERHAILPDHFLMVGNSMRSDILPVLTIGGYAAHVAHSMTWDHEVAEAPYENQRRFLSVDQLSELPSAMEALIDRQ